MNQEQVELYDRSMRVWGEKNQHKLLESSVIIIDVDSMTSEIAKNLSLSGVKIFISDNRVLSIKDFETNFFINEDDVMNKMTKQDALLKRITEVSKFAKVEIYKSTNNLDNNDTIIKLPNVKAVFTSFSTVDKLMEIEKYCNDNNIKLYCYLCIENISFFIFNDLNNKSTFKNRKDEFIKYISNIDVSKIKIKDFMKKNFHSIIFYYLLMFLRDLNNIKINVQDIDDIKSLCEFIKKLYEIYPSNVDLNKIICLFEKLSNDINEYYNCEGNDINTVTSISDFIESFKYKTANSSLVSIIAGLSSQDFIDFVIGNDKIETNHFFYFYDNECTFGNYY